MGMSVSFGALVGKDYGCYEDMIIPLPLNLPYKLPSHLVHKICIFIGSTSRSIFDYSYNLR